MRNLKVLIVGIIVVLTYTVSAVADFAADRAAAIAASGTPAAVVTIWEQADMRSYTVAQKADAFISWATASSQSSGSIAAGLAKLDEGLALVNIAPDQLCALYGTKGYLLANPPDSAAEAPDCIAAAIPWTAMLGVGASDNMLGYHKAQQARILVNNCNDTAGGRTKALTVFGNPLVSRMSAHRLAMQTIAATGGLDLRIAANRTLVENVFKAGVMVTNPDEIAAIWALLAWPPEYQEAKDDIITWLERLQFILPPNATYANVHGPVKSTISVLLP